MLSIDWQKQSGWQKPKIVPYGPFEIATSATSLHYGISSHDGISVLQNSKTGKLQAFRAQEHLKHFNDSSVHLDMPAFCENELLQCIKQLVQLDKKWLDVVAEPD